ncbi:hypothetical protein CC2G_000199 [Coprinopsis cinerea AmutBmut pab1-1]|nr:hypothetical protein CC2G_000199 [Coprinopsis cinerea AmutBmut pab1-1]
MSTSAGSADIAGTTSSSAGSSMVGLAPALYASASSAAASPAITTRSGSSSSTSSSSSSSYDNPSTYPMHQPQSINIRALLSAQGNQDFYSPSVFDAMDCEDMDLEEAFIRAQRAAFEAIDDAALARALAESEREAQVKSQRQLVPAAATTAMQIGQGYSPHQYQQQLQRPTAPSRASSTATTASSYSTSYSTSSSAFYGTAGSTGRGRSATQQQSHSHSQSRSQSTRIQPQPMSIPQPKYALVSPSELGGGGGVPRRHTRSGSTTSTSSIDSSTSFSSSSSYSYSSESSGSTSTSASSMVDPPSPPNGLNTSVAASGKRFMSDEEAARELARSWRVEAIQPQLIEAARAVSASPPAMPPAPLVMMPSWGSRASSSISTSSTSTSRPSTSSASTSTSTSASTSPSPSRPITVSASTSASASASASASRSARASFSSYRPSTPSSSASAARHQNASAHTKTSSTSTSSGLTNTKVPLIFSTASNSATAPPKSHSSTSASTSTSSRTTASALTQDRLRYHNQQSSSSSVPLSYFNPPPSTSTSTSTSQFNGNGTISASASKTGGTLGEVVLPSTASVCSVSTVSTITPTQKEPPSQQSSKSSKPMPVAIPSPQSSRSAQRGSNAPGAAMPSTTKSALSSTPTSSKRALSSSPAFPKTILSSSPASNKPTIPPSTSTLSSSPVVTQTRPRALSRVTPSVSPPTAPKAATTPPVHRVESRRPSTSSGMPIPSGISSSPSARDLAMGLMSGSLSSSSLNSGLLVGSPLGDRQRSGSGSGKDKSVPLEDEVESAPQLEFLSAPRECVKCGCVVSGEQGQAGAASSIPSDPFAPSFLRTLHVTCQRCSTMHCRGCFKPLCDDSSSVDVTNNPDATRNRPGCPKGCQGGKTCSIKSCCPLVALVAISQCIDVFDRSFGAMIEEMCPPSSSSSSRTRPAKKLVALLDTPKRLSFLELVLSRRERTTKAFETLVVDTFECLQGWLGVLKVLFMESSLVVGGSGSGNGKGVDDDGVSCFSGRTIQFRMDDDYDFVFPGRRGARSSVPAADDDASSSTSSSASDDDEDAIDERNTQTRQHLQTLFSTSTLPVLMHFFLSNENVSDWIKFSDVYMGILGVLRRVVECGCGSVLSGGSVEGGLSGGKSTDSKPAKNGESIRDLVLRLDRDTKGQLMRFASTIKFGGTKEKLTRHIER